MLPMNYDQNKPVFEVLFELYLELKQEIIQPKINCQ